MARADTRTPSNQDFGKPGVSFPWGDKAYPTITLGVDNFQNQALPAFLSAYSTTSPGYIVLTGVTTTNCKLTGIQRSLGDNANVNVTFKWETLPGPELIRKGFDQDSGAATRVVRQKVALPASPTPNANARTFDGIPMLSQDSSVDPIDVNTGWLVTTYQEMPSAIQTVYDQDEETQVYVTTTYQVVPLPIPTPLAAPDVGILISYKKIDSQKALKITRDFTGFLAFTYTEQRFAAYTFPALFDYTVYFYTDECGAFSNIRASFSTLVQTTVTIEYTDTPTAIVGLSLIPKTLQLGKGVQISSGVLVDAGMFTYIGVCTGTVTWDASSPDYSTYTGTIMNTSQIVGGEVVLWKANIYRSMTVNVVML